MLQRTVVPAGQHEQPFRLVRRLVQLLPTLFFVSVLIFSLQKLLPGDPALVMAGEEKDPEVIEEIRRQYRLDQPLPVQYLYWIKGVLTGDLGESMRLKVSVGELIAQKLPVTLQLAVMAMIIAQRVSSIPYMPIVLYIGTARNAAGMK